QQKHVDHGLLEDSPAIWREVKFASSRLTIELGTGDDIADARPNGALDLDAVRAQQDWRMCTQPFACDADRSCAAIDGSLKAVPVSCVPCRCPVAVTDVQADAGCRTEALLTEQCCR